MITAVLPIGWIPYDPVSHLIEPGSWSPMMIPSGPTDQLAIHMLAHEYGADRIKTKLQRIDDVTSGRYRPGMFGGDNDGFVAYGNGYFYVASSYEDRDQLIVTAAEFRRAFEWLLELVTHPDFTNPEAHFEPLTVEVVAHGPGSDERYQELGGGFFIEESPNTDHLN